MSASSSREGRNWPRTIILSVAAALVLFYLVTCVRVFLQSRRDEARPAGAIVVFGAAEYAGRPSPVFKARLDHAYDLFERGLAPVIIVSGGSGGETRFSEGQVGRDYLIAKGIGDRHLIAETQGDNTSESAERIAVILRANGLHDCIAVSDGYHMFRTKKFLKRLGVTAYGSPRAQEPKLAPKANFGLVLRESLSYMLWYFHIT